MRHQRQRYQLSLKIGPRRALIAGLAREMARRGRIEITLDRAKAVQPFIDRLVKLAKANTLHARRQLVSKLRCAESAEHFIKDVGPSAANRQSGFTRIIRSHNRIGDGAQMVLLEFTDPIQKVKPPASKQKKKEKKTGDKPAPSAHEESRKAKKPTGEVGRPSKAVPPEKGEAGAETKPKDTEAEKGKKGGFLSGLRRFLKGEE